MAGEEALLSAAWEQLTLTARCTSSTLSRPKRSRLLHPCKFRRACSVLHISFDTRVDMFWRSLFILGLRQPAALQHQRNILFIFFIIIIDFFIIVDDSSYSF
jgi:hypothetical protein